MGAATVMGEHTAASPAELRREIERLRVENLLLRSLLGLDSPNRRQPNRRRR